MPALEQMDRAQTAVLWPRASGRAGVDKFGNPVVGDAEEVTVRWNKTKREATNAQGNKVQIVADIVADQALTIGDIMWLGSFDDLSGTAYYHVSMVPTADVCQVITDDTTVDLKGRDTRYEYGLMRYTDTIPTA